MLHLKGRIFEIMRLQRKDFQTNVERGEPWRVVVINYFPILSSRWEICTGSKQINMTLVLARRPCFTLRGGGRSPWSQVLSHGGAIRPLQIWMNLPGVGKISKRLTYWSSQWKTCHSLPHPHVASVDRRDWKKLVFKNICTCDMFCAVLLGALCF